jgi:hypothetical protein
MTKNRPRAQMQKIVATNSGWLGRATAATQVLARFDNACRLNWSTQHPSGHVDLTMGSSGPIVMACSSILPKQAPLFFAGVSLEIGKFSRVLLGTRSSAELHFSRGQR